MRGVRPSYAGIATRAVALALDALIAQVAVLSAGAVLALVASLVWDVHLGAVGKTIAAAAWVVAVAGYFVLFWSTAGQTPGMRLMDLRVIDRAGADPGLGRSLFRVVALAMSIVPLFAGFLPVLVDDRRRGLHDLLAGTAVIYGNLEHGVRQEAVGRAPEPSPNRERLAARGRPDPPPPPRRSTGPA
jgi:uncharacterized RDD family membrane protein YckC